MDDPVAESPVTPEPPAFERHHRDVHGGKERAAVFGVSDGLVSNVSLILGVAGADPDPSFVRLAGLAGLIAGAASMAFGEYISMRIQRELFERELEMERREHDRNPNVEIVELTQLYQSRGIDADIARQVAMAVMRDPELALETHAREELGLAPGSLGSPLAAAVSSFLAFALGAILPLVPWLMGSGSGAVVASIVVSGVAALGVGGALAYFTERPRVRMAMRQLVFAAVPAAVTYTIGSVIGITTG